MNKTGLAGAILSRIGGAGNVTGVEYCATRLHLTLRDNTKAELAGLRGLDKVVAVVFRSGQLQIILGTGVVLDTYHEMQHLLAAETQADQAVDIRPAGLPGYMRRIANVFLPLIPVLVGSGMLMGINSLLQRLGVVGLDNQVSQLLQLFASSVFVFLPVLVGVTGAREFGGTPLLGGAAAGLLMHPSLNQLHSLTIGGFSLSLQRGTGGVIAALLVVLFMSLVERKLRRLVPSVLALILTPLLTLAITGFATLFLLQPLGAVISDGVISAVLFAIHQGGFFTGMMLGAVYSTLVTTGMHQGLNPLYLDMLSKTGVNMLLPILAMADTAQAGAALAVYFKTTDRQLKRVIINAFPVCLLGITEPIMFAVNLPLVRPFAAAAIGGALGGGFIAMLQVKAISLGLSALSLLAIIKEGDVLLYAAGFMIAFVSAFCAAWMLGFDDGQPDEQRKFVGEKVGENG